MRFLWDRQKNEVNLTKRGFDLAFATLVFKGPTVERTDDRQDYGEKRVIALGIADGIALTVVYTDRAEGGGEVVRRIISTLVSNHRERKAFSEAFKKG